MGRGWKLPPQFGADAVEQVVDAVRAERALVAADPSIGRLGWEVLAAPLAVWPELEHVAVNASSNPA